MKKIFNPGTLLLYFAAAIIVLAAASCSKNDTTAPPLSFSTPNQVKPATSGGMAEIKLTVTGGQWPYKYFIVPEYNWNAGDNIYDMLLLHDFSRLYRYTYFKNTIVVSPGTSVNPKYYWVAVQDILQSAYVAGSNMMAWWKRVAVYDL